MKFEIKRKSVERVDTSVDMQKRKVCGRSLGKKS